jgi:hypothetical protein
MGSSKPGNIDLAASVATRVIISTTLVVLLSTSQFSQASGGTASKPLFENDSDLTRAEQPGNEHPELLLADIVDESAFLLPQVSRSVVESVGRPVGEEIHATCSDIRAPPRFS